MSVVEELRELRAELADVKAQLRVSRREMIHARPKDQEHPDPTPVEIPLGSGPPTVEELVRGYVEAEMSAYAQTQDLGTFEEEDDFDEEDPDLLDLSGFEVHEYEMVEDEVPSSAEEVPEAPSEPSEGEVAPAEPQG